MPSTPRLILAVLGALALVLPVAACGALISGTPTRTGPDFSTLGTGNYQVTPRVIGNAKNMRQARAREAQRLADFVILPGEADPSYVENAWDSVRGHVVLDRRTLANLVINDTFDDTAADLVAGWVNAQATAAADGEPRRIANIAVLLFPDAATAARVGPALEHDDFTFTPANEPVDIARYPGTTAHWRPAVSSIGSWTVHDRYVVYIKIEDRTRAPDRAALTGHVERLLSAQLPLLDQFRPTPVADLPRIALDPDGLLGRTLPSAPEELLRAEPDGVYTDRGMLSLLLEGKLETLETLRRNDVDLVAFSQTVVFRSRTARGARGLWEDWRLSAHLDEGQRVVGTPSGMPDADIECISQSFGEAAAERLFGHLCMLRVDRYIVQAREKQLPDLHQQMAAQYALLTSP